jgi:aryl-alcohol dehydrogenase-like predicted oxidoreductase
MGVIAKRPIANAAWRYTQKPDNSYYVPYWERLQKLQYDFLRDAKQAVSTALRFTLSAPGVHTAIVGTKNPRRWRENAELLAAGPLPRETIDKIQARWREAADASWVGQI